ncbi:MAG TPA: STAS domain-containing protein [Rubrivivax sp.]|nr:STAS domain-containing protein [Rubrivivax sp.]
MELHCEELSPRVTRVALNGRLDTLGVDQIEVKFNAAVLASGRDTLLDLTGVSFVSSMGIRVLVTAARNLRHRQARLVMFGAQPLVRETLQSMAIDSLLALAETEAEARTILGV